MHAKLDFPMCLCMYVPYEQCIWTAQTPLQYTCHISVFVCVCVFSKPEMKEHFFFLFVIMMMNNKKYISYENIVRKRTQSMRVCIGGYQFYIYIYKIYEGCPDCNSINEHFLPTLACSY